MKKILLLILLISSLSWSGNLQAQCTLSNIVVELNSATPSGSNCIVNMNISFDMTDNAGNKYIWLNLWKSTDYSFINFNYNSSGAKGPTLDELNGADNTHRPVAVIGINNNVSPVVYLTSYSPDGLIIPTTGASITNNPVSGVSKFVLRGVQITIPGGCAGLVIQGDVWSSQANSANSPIHCASTGISFYGDPTISGQLRCVDPREAQILLNTVSTAPLTVNYTVYIDKGTVGVKEAGDPVAISTTANFTISSSTPYNSGFLPYTGNSFSPDRNLPLLVEVKVVAPFSKTIYGNLFNSCISLPVDFKSFTAIRNKTNVLLKWETVFEQNNTGFSVERNTNGVWEEVAFIPTKAQNGNSDVTLSYGFIDPNTVKGITLYRIKQTDLNAKKTFSEIRSVRGEGQPEKTIVYPNPASDGRVNVVFENATTIRNISLIDMNGRVIRDWRNISNNNIQIDNLNTGIYSLRIINSGTGEQVIERIIVNKR